MINLENMCVVMLRAAVGMRDNVGGKKLVFLLLYGIIM